MSSVATSSTASTRSSITSPSSRRRTAGGGLGVTFSEEKEEDRSARNRENGDATSSSSSSSSAAPKVRKLQPSSKSNANDRSIEISSPISPSASAASSSSSSSSSSTLARRSTLPSQVALSAMIIAPPVLYPSLTPICDLCSTDHTDTRNTCSHIYCSECDLHLCGSEPIDEGVKVSNGEQTHALRVQPKACNWRLHRHRVMQGHVRIPASTAMYIDKLMNIESSIITTSSSTTSSHNRSRKEIVLQVYRLPMLGICWQLQSMLVPTDWLDFDVVTSEILENILSVKRGDAVKISEQYEVVRTSSSAFALINTLTSKRTTVRRLDARAMSEESVPAPMTRPNSRPSSARPSTRTSPTRRASGRRVDVDTNSQNGTPPVLSPASRLFGNGSNTASALASPNIGARHHPGLSRHASVDVRQMASYTEWTTHEWDRFAAEQVTLSSDSRGALGHELEDISESNQSSLYPLFDMERGNALLLAIYHRAYSSASTLLQKGYSSNSLSSWTRISAVQLACMNGDVPIVKLLLKNHVEMRYKSLTSTTMCLEYAVKSGCLELVKMLLKLRLTPVGGDERSRCIAYSDLMLREQRKKKKKKRSTWVDIGEEEDEEEQDGDMAKNKKHHSSKNEKHHEEEDNSIGTPNDQMSHLYPHLLTCALNVPPILSHTLEVIEFLLERMLSRVHIAQENVDDIPLPEFELSRYHEWCSVCISSSSYERLSFLLTNRQRYTSHLKQLDFVSQDFSETLTDARYANAVLREQKSFDQLWFQAVVQYANLSGSGIEATSTTTTNGTRKFQRSESDASDEEQDDDEEELLNGDSHSTSASSSSASQPFPLLSLLLSHCCDINHIETDTNDGTQISALYIALRERKLELVAYLVERGADLNGRLRINRIDQRTAISSRPSSASVSRHSREETVIDSDGEEQYYHLSNWLEYIREECAYDPDAISRVREVIETAKVERHRRAKEMVQVVLQWSHQLAGLPPPEFTSPPALLQKNAKRPSSAGSSSSSKRSSTSSSTSALHLTEPFSVSILHLLASYCYGEDALVIGADVSATGVTLSRPTSPH